jgi:nucleotide-binding universal stress UspA family protein
MFDHIVVIVDESETSHYAVGASITLAKELGAKIHYCLTVDPDLTAPGIGAMPMAEMALALRKKTLRDTLQRAKHAGVSDATGEVLSEGAVTGVVAMAHARKADAIMLGFKPRVGILRPFIRSLTESLLTQTTIPIIAVRRPARGYLTHRIIVPIVDDVLSQLAVNEAIGIARRFHSTLVFCSLISDAGEASAHDAVNKAMAQAQLHGVKAEQLVLAPMGTISKTIVQNADLHSCDSIIMATHLRQGIPRIVEGSVTEAVVYASDVPVVMVRAPSI